MRTVWIIMLALVLTTAMWPGTVEAESIPRVITINGVELRGDDLFADSSTPGTPRFRSRRILGHDAFVVEGGFDIFGIYAIGRCPGCRGPARLVIEDGVTTSGVNRLVLTDAIVRVATATPAQLAAGLTMLFEVDFTTPLSGDQYTHGVIMDGTFACRGTGRCNVPTDNRIAVSAFGRELDNGPQHQATYNLVKPGRSNVEPSLGFTVSKSRSFARQGTEGILCDSLERDCAAQGQLKVVIRFGAAGDSVTLPGSIGLLSATQGGEAGRLQVEQAMKALLTCTDAPGGLVSWFPGAGSAEDIIGANDGVPQNGAGFGAGQVGQGFSLDGVDDFVQTAAPVGLPLGNAARTMMLWFRTPTLTESALVQYGTTVGGSGRMFGLITSGTGPVKLSFFGHGGADLPGVTELQPDTWYHGAVTYDGTSVKLYLDGELEDEADVPLDTVLDAQGLTIGFRPPGSVWQGELDEVMIFDRALSKGEIAAVHDAGSVGLCQPACASPGTGGPPGARACVLDPFFCYKSRDTVRSFCTSAAPLNAGQACANEAACGGGETTSFCVPGAFTPTGVTLVDAFESATHDVERRVGLCTPARTNGAGIGDAATHLTAYGISLDDEGLAHERRTNLVVTNQFGTIRLSTLEADRLLVPAAKDRTQPVAAPALAAHRVDHYACYKVKVTGGTPKFQTVEDVTVADQFVPGGKTVDLKKPTRLCLPADKNEEGVKQPGAALLCYMTKTATGAPRHVRQRGVYIGDQFGEGQLDTVKEEELCMPATVTAP